MGGNGVVTVFVLLKFFRVCLTGFAYDWAGDDRWLLINPLRFGLTIRLLRARRSFAESGKATANFLRRFFGF